jgi:alpha-D-ribose 1-methylphosphonate 5-triphosphate synthase subunit PhnH
MDPVHDTRACFRALVDAMSRPGTVHELPSAPADHAVLATLVDHEVSLHTADDDIRDALAREGRLSEAPQSEATIVHALESTDGAVRALGRGTRKEPSTGATIVYRVAGLSNTTAKQDDEHTTLELCGPGVPGDRTLAVDGLVPDEARALADAQSPYPRGVDAILTAEQTVAALPRSVEMEVR